MSASRRLFHPIGRFEAEAVVNFAVLGILVRDAMSDGSGGFSFLEAHPPGLRLAEDILDGDPGSGVFGRHMHAGC